LNRRSSSPTTIIIFELSNIGKCAGIPFQSGTVVNFGPRSFNAASVTTELMHLDFDDVRKLLKLWCGEGDLNPHEIAPASTSSGYRAFWSGLGRSKPLILHCGPAPRGPARCMA